MITLVYTFESVLFRENKCEKSNKGFLIFPPRKQIVFDFTSQMFDFLYYYTGARDIFCLSLFIISSLKRKKHIQTNSHTHKHMDIHTYTNAFTHTHRRVRLKVGASCVDRALTLEPRGAGVRHVWCSELSLINLALEDGYLTTQSKDKTARGSKDILSPRKVWSLTPYSPMTSIVRERPLPHTLTHATHTIKNK